MKSNIFSSNFSTPFLFLFSISLINFIELEARVIDLIMKSNTVFIKRAIHLLIGLTMLLVSKTSDDDSACNLVLSLFNTFSPIDSNFVNIDTEFNFTVNMCLEKYQDRFKYVSFSFFLIFLRKKLNYDINFSRTTFNSKYSRNGIHGGFFVRILKIYDENIKFEIILSDLLNENLKIYNRKPLVEYLEEKLKSDEKKVCNSKVITFVIYSVFFLLL